MKYPHNRMLDDFNRPLARARLLMVLMVLMVLRVLMYVYVSRQQSEYRRQSGAGAGAGVESPILSTQFWGCTVHYSLVAAYPPHNLYRNIPQII